MGCFSLSEFLDGSQAVQLLTSSCICQQMLRVLWEQREKHLAGAGELWVLPGGLWPKSVSELVFGPGPELPAREKQKRREDAGWLQLLKVRCGEPCRFLWAELLLSQRRECTAPELCRVRRSILLLPWGTGGCDLLTSNSLQDNLTSLPSWGSSSTALGCPWPWGPEHLCPPAAAILWFRSSAGGCHLHELLAGAGPEGAQQGLKEPSRALSWVK